jgi:hypothetical protein
MMNEYATSVDRTVCGRLPYVAAFFVILPLALASCGGQPIQPGAMAKTVPPEQAIAMPPPAGPSIVSVIDRRYDNAIEQEIYLATSAVTPGQNFLKVQMFGTASPFRYSSNNLGAGQVSQSRIASEMASSLRGVSMVRSQFYVQNSYGPFGYAFGRSAGDLCMYGWQQIRSPAESISPMNNYGTVQVRARICEAGATEQKLLAFMYNFTINASVDSMGWNPYGQPAPMAPGFGMGGAPSYPRPASTETIVPVTPQRPTTIMRRAPAAAPVRTVTAAPAPVQTEPAVPLVRVPTVSGASGRSLAYPVAPTAGVAPRTAPPSYPGTSPVQNPVRVPSPSCSTGTEGSDASCR